MHRQIHRLIDIIVSKTYNAVLDTKDLIFTIRKCAVNGLFYRIVEALANVFDCGRDDVVCFVFALVSKCLVRVNADAVFLASAAASITPTEAGPAATKTTSARWNTE